MARITDAELLARLAGAKHAGEAEALLDLYEARRDIALLRGELDRLLDLLEELLRVLEGGVGGHFRITRRGGGGDS
jgi:hypothetical protein